MKFSNPANVRIWASTFFVFMTLTVQAGELKEMNVKFMVRGYCFAGSRVDDKALGGFGKSDNAPKKLANKQLGQNNEITLVALPNEQVPFAGHYQGMRLLLINRTGNEAEFPASDSRLSIVQEALDTDGKWKPIEYLPSSWCGNSYHRVFLPKDHYWEFAAPRYTGSIKTKLRFALHTRGQKPIYSNEFQGSINREQFSIRQGHTPSNIMDPYRD